MADGPPAPRSIQIQSTVYCRNPTRSLKYASPLAAPQKVSYIAQCGVPSGRRPSIDALIASLTRKIHHPLLEVVRMAQQPGEHHRIADVEHERIRAKPSVGIEDPVDIASSL